MTPAIIAAFCAGTLVGALVLIVWSSLAISGRISDEEFAELAHDAGWRSEDEWGERP